jgi:hypothetical protein
MPNFKLVRVRESYSFQARGILIVLTSSPLKPQTKLGPNCQSAGFCPDIREVSSCVSKAIARLLRSITMVHALAHKVQRYVPMLQNFADSAVLGFFSKVYSVAIFCLKMRVAN